MTEEMTGEWSGGEIKREAATAAKCLARTDRKNGVEAADESVRGRRAQRVRSRG